MAWMCLARLGRSFPVPTLAPPVVISTQAIVDRIHHHDLLQFLFALSRQQAIPCRCAIHHPRTLVYLGFCLGPPQFSGHTSAGATRIPSVWRSSKRPTTERATVQQTPLFPHYLGFATPERHALKSPSCLNLFNLPYRRRNFRLVTLIFIDVVQRTSPCERWLLKEACARRSADDVSL